MAADVASLRAIHGELERLHERCLEQLLKGPEVHAALQDLDGRLRAACGADSDLFRLADRRLRESTVWTTVTVSGYVEKRDCTTIERRLAIARDVLNRASPSFGVSPEDNEDYYLPPDDVYGARQRLYHVLSSARKTVTIVDQHLDPLVLEFVDVLDPTIAVCLLTGDPPKQLFVVQLKVLAGVRGQLEARSSRVSHDRWLLLDQSTLWHLGASINGIGKTASRLSRISGGNHDTVLADIHSWWASATPL